MSRSVDAQPRAPGRLAGVLGVALDRLIDVLAVTAALLLLGLTLLTGVSVLMRYFLGQPIAWSLEVTEYALLYITFLAAPWVLRRGGHVRIDLLVGRLPQRLRVGAHVLATLMGLAVSAVLVYYGTLVTHNAFERGLDMINVLRVPRYLVLWVIPFGSLVLLLQFLRMLFRPAESALGSAVQEPDPQET